jgi:hypothetical protein
VFLGRKKVRLATPSNLRGEAGQAYRAFISGELDLDTMKGAIWALKTMSEMMRGPEAERLVDDIKTEWTRQKANGHAADHPRPR